MKISSFTIIIAFIAISLAGCALIPLLPVRLTPSRNLPSLTISFSMPHNSAKTVESEVTSMIESIVARVDGVKSINSKSYNGGGRVTIDLDRHSDLNTVRFDVSALIRQAWDDMPEGVSYPTIIPQAVEKESSRPFMTFTLNAPSNPAEIQAYGEDFLKPLLSQIPGISKVELTGAQPMEWQLYYDFDRLSALGLSASDIRDAISEHYNSEFIGMAKVVSVNGEEYIRLAIKPNEKFDDFIPSEIAIPLKSGNAIALDKLITVAHTESRAKSHFRINGLNSIYVNITAAEDANQLSLSDRINETIRRFEAAMPYGYMVGNAYDATESIREELDKIYFRTGLTVLILLLFVGIVSLNLRYVLLITVGVTVNLAIACVFYYLADVEIELYSLAGITISLNLVIDNLIVMTDHYTRRNNAGVFTAILAATLTTAGALSVVYFMDERARLSLEDFVAVIIINLAVSLAVALFLVPALARQIGLQRNYRTGKFRSPRKRFSLFLSHVYTDVVKFAVRFRVALMILIILAFGLPVFMLPEKIEDDVTNSWAARYNSIFGSSEYQEKIRPIVDVVLGGALRLFAEKVHDGSYWDRNPGEPVLQINATLPNGATIEQMDALIRKMEAYLSGFPEIRQFQTSIPSARRASISVYFKRENQNNGFPYRLKGDLVAKALTLGGGSWSVYGLEDQGFSNDVKENAGSYHVRLTGYNYEELSDWAYRMRDTLLTHRRIKEVSVSSEFSYWKDDYTEFHLVIDRDMLAKNGVTASQLYNAIEPTFGREINCGQIILDRSRQNINLYSFQSDKYDISALMSQPFKIGDKTFKLSDICTIEKRQAPQDIVKKDQEYEICLQYEYMGSDMQGEKVLEKDLETINSLMPVGYKAENEKMLLRSNDRKDNYWLLLLVAVIIFFITSILFDSLRQPFAIILMIPMSFIGVFMTFYLFRLNFDQGGFASFILLAGITVNAAIYVLNEYNSLRRRNPSASAAGIYIRAFRIKIIPILLTIISTMLGFVPFLTGETRDSFWFPLAVGTIGGLVASLICIIIYLPILVLPKIAGYEKKVDDLSGFCVFPDYFSKSIIILERC